MKKINSISISIYLLYIFQAFFYLSFLNQSITKVKYNYFIFLAIAIFLGIGIILLFNYLLNMNNKNIFNNVHNKILVFLLLIVPTIFSIHALNAITSYISYVYLSDVNKIFIMLSLMLAVFYLIKNNTISFFRCSTLIFYLYILLEIVTSFLLLFYVDFHNLLPISFNLEVAIDNSYYFITFLISPILFLLFLSKNIIDDNKKISKNIFITYLAIAGLIFLKSVLSIAILGYSQTVIYNYPDVILYKNINLFSCIERMEWLLCFNSLTNMFFLISLALYYVKEGLNYIYPLKGDAYYIYPLMICVIVAIASYFLTIDIEIIVYLLIAFIVFHIFLCIYNLLK